MSSQCENTILSAFTLEQSTIAIIYYLFKFLAKFEGWREGARVTRGRGLLPASPLATALMVTDHLYVEEYSATIC